MICNSKEQSALEICGKAKLEVDVDLPEVVYANNVITKSSYLLFPTYGREGVLYVETKGDKQIYIYNTETNEYEVVGQTLTPMTDEEVDEKVEEIINVTKEKIINTIKGVD